LRRFRKTVSVGADVTTDGRLVWQKYALSDNEKKNRKLQLSPGLVASYDIQTGNGVGLFWDLIYSNS